MTRPGRETNRGCTAKPGRASIPGIENGSPEKFIRAAAAPEVGDDRSRFDDSATRSSRGRTVDLVVEHVYLLQVMSKSTMSFV